MTARERFEDLYVAHGAAVLAYARRRSPTTAEDVLSEVFLVAWRRLEELPDDPRAWLLGVARRTIATHRRGDGRRLALQQKLASEAEPALTATGDEDNTPVRRALLELSEKDREALLLIAWEGLAPGDAARVLGIRRGTFNVRLHRARRRFASALARLDGGAEVARNVQTTTEAR